MTEDKRKCNMCNIEKQLHEFHNKTYDCKTCTSIRKSKTYFKNKIDERTPYRERLKQLCIKDDMTNDDFNKHFIPFEKFEIMKNLPELYTIHQCNNIRKLDKNQNKQDYENKHFLDVAFIIDNKLNSAYRIHII